MIRILGIYPLYGNGGIASWTKKFLATFPNEDFSITPLPSGSDKDFTKYKSSFDRAWCGLKAMFKLRRLMHKELSSSHYDIVHITTSAGMSVIRDAMVVRVAHKYKAKIVMHCRFGTVKELCESNSLWGCFFRANIKKYDQIWVLDKRSETFLKQHTRISNKIHLTPNSIEVPAECDLNPKQYHKIGFIGNIIQTKGVFELVEAVLHPDIEVQLMIAGPGSDNDVTALKKLAGKEWGNKIVYSGKLPNDEAVRLIESLDIIALPTYYPGEAFPISIIESMSRGKLVISCPRAAIPDMLTDLNGNMCGILVPERSSEAIYEALVWINHHKVECDNMCEQAYKKVKGCYGTDTVYVIYRDNFRDLLNK